jgi:hypothetical protein
MLKFANSRRLKLITRIPPAIHAANRVRGQLTDYDCPDIPTIDRYLLGLTAQLAERTRGKPRLAAALRPKIAHDIDLLLDRRSMLTLVAGFNADDLLASFAAGSA